MSHHEGYSKCICNNCGGHIEFPSAGAGQTIPCPHCNWPTLLVDKEAVESARIGGGPAVRKLIFRIFFVAAITVVAAGAALIGYFAKHPIHFFAPVNQASPSVNHTSTSSVPVVVKPVAPPDPWHGLMAGPVTLEKEGDGRLVYAVGILTNKSDHERFGVRVELDVFNSANEKLGATTDYKDSILPGKSWKFKAMVIDQAATSAKLISVKEN